MENRAVFLIDGPNFYKNLRRCGLERGHLDFTRLAENLSGPRTVAGVVFFTSPTDRESDAENYANHPCCGERRRSVVCGKRCG